MTSKITRLRFAMIPLFGVLSLLATPCAQPQSYVETTLYPLMDSDGLNPTSLVEGADGNFYGIATFGGLAAAATPVACNLITEGVAGCGTIFKLTRSGAYSVVYTFKGGTDGAYPLTLLQGGDGNLYGVAAYGGNIPTGIQCGPGSPCTGYGTIFEISPAGGPPNVLYAFSGLSGADGADGAFPNSLIQASDGNLYGTTYSNTVFRISLGGSNFTPIPSSFGAANGEYPTGIVQGSDGNLYGTTQAGGSSACDGYGCGTIYSLSLSGAFSLIYPLPDEEDGDATRNRPAPRIRITQPGRGLGQCPPNCPQGVLSAVYRNALTEGADGSLYGTTPTITVVIDTQGDTDLIPATVFKVLPSSQSFYNLYTFGGTSDGGGSSSSLFLAGDGNFYGTSGNTVFKQPPFGSFQTIYTSNSSSSSSVGSTFGALLQGSDGPLYSEAQVGGSATACQGDGCGTIFNLSATPAIPPAVQLTLSSTTSPLGISVRLSWSVLNAFSNTAQQCYAFVQGGAPGAGNWTGLQPGLLANGIYSGGQVLTPTAPGTYTYALTCGGYESGFATLTVPPLAITTPGLPTGVVGTMYTAGLVANNGLAPYNWTITSGALPPPLSLDPNTGIISGIPSQASASTFTVQVLDSEGTPAVATAQYSLTVGVGALTLSTANLTFTSTVGATSAPQSVTLTNLGGAGLAINSISTLPGFGETNNCGGGLGPGGSCTIAVTFTPTTNGSATGSLTIVDSASGSPQIVALSGTQVSLEFVPIAPCRILDTRKPAGPFGGPAIGGGQMRSFPILQSACGLPSIAAAYALNVTVVPSGPLGYLTVWPAGGPQPLVSLLNSLDGRVKANAAIVPAGDSGAVSIYAEAQTPTNVIIDISGYFVSANASSLQFFPLTPCRIADTRGTPEPLGGPSLSGGQGRSFPVQASDCQIPPSAQAYSLNITAVPSGPLGYLTIWPAGEAQPTVSTLNAETGTDTANAAIVPAGSGGQVSVFVTDDADLVLDVNGYFALPSNGGNSLYTTVPCRVLDTRELPVTPFPGTYNLNVPSSGCTLLSTASAYVLNATVVPSGALGYLSLWPSGATQPVVSTLNATDGSITSNMAIVPATDGAIDAYAPDGTQLILDVASYFAP